MSLLNLIVISGIFGKKDDELDILPPPPPFPHIGEKEKEMAEREKNRKAEEKRKEEQERLRLKEEKQKQKELERKNLEKIRVEEEKERMKNQERKKLEEQKKKAQEEKIRQKKLEKKKKEEEKNRKALENKKREEEIKRKNKKLMKQRVQKAKEKAFHFLNIVGLSKTEKEKADHHRQRKEYLDLRKNAEKIHAEEARLMELERKKQAKIADKKEKGIKKKKDFEIEEKPEIEQIGGKAERTWLEEKPAFKVKKKSIFRKIFMGKDEELEKELEELDKVGAEPLESIEEPKIMEPEESEKAPGEIEKPHDAAGAEEEIQKAIEGIKKKEKKPSILGRLFEKKEVKEQAMETPDVMPSFEEVADEVELVEEKIHKARLALMDFKFDDAKRIYIDIMKIYSGMDAKKKARVYPDIKDLYYERKSAEKYAK
ncbi:hypothetical protein HYU09_02930 [Candidatus Woesearchaeota archaeon]|nr:hypothetical protein [Candidatus Woesearchaeota archaeon]